MSRYLLALDNGGSEIKASVFDLRGTECSSCSYRVPMIVNAPGYTERHAEEVWDANTKAIREVMLESEIRATDIAAIGLTGYGNGICLIDENGNAVADLIVSTDERASEICQDLRKQGVEKALFPLTKQTLWSAQPAALLPWFKKNRPEVLKRSRWCLGIKDFIRYRLTGNVATEITEASSGCLVNLDTRTYDKEIFSLLGISELKRLMPEIIESTAISGHVSSRAAEACGLIRGIPVVGGYFDIDAAGLASGMRDTDTLTLIAGTWSVNEHLSETVNNDYDHRANTATISYWPDRFLIEESWATSASNFNWFLSQILKPNQMSDDRDRLYRQCNTTIEKLDPSTSEVVFVPYLYDSATTPGAHATFLNLSGYTTRDHLLLSVYEGVCFSTKLNVSRLKRPAGEYQSARLSGGVSKSPVWSQLMADVLGMPIDTLSNTELSAQGAAMGAGIASGVFSSLDEAIKRMVRIGHHYVPCPERQALYENKYMSYLRALKALATFHDEED